jgi:antitoxin component of MazEF toxin-antitoxin module
MGQLAAVLNQSMEKTVRMEGVAVIKRAMQMVGKSQPAAKIELSARESIIKRFGSGKQAGSVNRFSNKRGAEGGFAWLINRTNGKVMPMGRVWSGEALGTPADRNGGGWETSDERWLEFKRQYYDAAKKEKQVVSARLGARDLTKKSWLELMQKVAGTEPVKLDQRIMRATPVKGGSRTVASALGAKSGSSFTLTVANDSGIAAKQDGQRKLLTAIQIRRAFFTKSFERGFYSDAKFLARNHKWLKVE